MPHAALVSALPALRKLGFVVCSCWVANAQAQISLVQENTGPLLRSYPAPPSAEPVKGGFVADDRKPLPPEVQDTLRQINAYRASGATCGSQRFEPAAPLAWSELLQAAAARHADDMAVISVANQYEHLGHLIDGLWQIYRSIAVNR